MRSSRATTVCRRSGVGEVCDIAEFCDGTNKTCPADAVEPSSTVCRADHGRRGVRHAPRAATAPTRPARPTRCCRMAPPAVARRASATSPTCATGRRRPARQTPRARRVCRPSTGTCDVAESCDGVGDTCPADGFVADGTNCDDALFCNGTQTCTGGTCGGGSSPCAMGESCDERRQRLLQRQLPGVTGQLRDGGQEQAADQEQHQRRRQGQAGVEVDQGRAASTQTDFADPVGGTADYTLCFYTGNALIESANRAAGRWQVVRDQHQGLQVQGHAAATPGSPRSSSRAARPGRARRW